MIAAPVFLRGASRTASAAERERWKTAGIFPLFEEPLSLEKFLIGRNAPRSMVVDLPGTMPAWPTALTLFRVPENDSWLRWSVRAALENPVLLESMPEWLAERLLLVPDGSDASRLPPRCRPWREILANDLPPLERYASPSSPTRPWISVFTFGEGPFEEARLTASLLKSGFSAEQFEIVRTTGGPASSTRTKILINDLFRVARGDQILLLNDARTSPVNADALIEAAPHFQMIGTPSAALIFRGALLDCGGFTPAKGGFAETLDELAARMDLFGLKTAKESGERMIPYFADSRARSVALWRL